MCVTVTLTDGVVVARSAFHHSLNYRSVVALGKAEAVLDPEAKTAALGKITDHLLPGRVAEVRERLLVFLCHCSWRANLVKAVQGVSNTSTPS